jgi:hypothetical protein
VFVPELQMAVVEQESPPILGRHGVVVSARWTDGEVFLELGCGQDGRTAAAFGEDPPPDGLLFALVGLGRSFGGKRQTKHSAVVFFGLSELRGGGGGPSDWVSLRWNPDLRLAARLGPLSMALEPMRLERWRGVSSGNHPPSGQAAVPTSKPPTTER